MSQSKITTDTLNLAEVAIRLGSIYEREAILDTMLIDLPHRQSMACVNYAVEGAK